MGASLSQIGEEVGLKKQSIYSHFKGKDDLFLQVLRDAKEMDLSSTLRYFRNIDSKNPEKALYGYLQLIIDLFQQDEQLKFWLRMSFFPPAHLEKVIEQEVIDIDEKERAILEEKFQDWINAKLIIGDTALTTTFAYLGVVDSILLELVYGNDEKQLKTKLAASWTVFWRGISHQ
uniref:HTH tetR-type domain-containing protein n=1 Tax=Batrachochytrium dendrobatidis (strain JAM81 / FGSC 10211) TaxID=684364 RepID=F4PG33_BATDJ|eukprot:XP_006683567.1 LOW QUALITY PROTEIN: hypothetical protein BATDEDRAFT_93323 [Batrachochytrium dendrobatidis JAM81]